MTEQTTTVTTGAESNADGLTGEAQGNVSPEPENGSEKPMPREQRYRLELRATEAKLGEANERMQQLQTRELHRLAGELLAAPEDISLTGKDLADFLTPEGWVDHEAVADAVQEPVSSRPGLAKNPKQPAFDPSQGRGGGDAKPKLGWDALLRG